MPKKQKADQPNDAVDGAEAQPIYSLEALCRRVADAGNGGIEHARALKELPGVFKAAGLVVPAKIEDREQVACEFVPWFDTAHALRNVGNFTNIEVAAFLLTVIEADGQKGKDVPQSEIELAFGRFFTTLEAFPLPAKAKIACASKDDATGFMQFAWHIYEPIHDIPPWRVAEFLADMKPAPAPEPIPEPESPAEAPVAPEVKPEKAKPKGKGKKAKAEAAVEAAPVELAPLQASVTRENFLRGIETAKKAVSKKTTLPVLNNLHLRASAVGNLVLFGTDLEQFVEVAVRESNTVGNGMLTLPAKNMLEAVKRAPKGATIGFLQNPETNEGVFTINGAALTLRGLPADEFPTMPVVEAYAEFQAPADLLLAAFQHIEVAASDDETRPVLTTVCVEMRNESTTFAATDTHRLAMVRTSINAIRPLDDGKTVLLPGACGPGGNPRATLCAMLKRQGAEPVRVEVGPTHTCFTFSGARLVIRNVESQFPNFEKVIPTNPEWFLVAGRAELMAALEQVGMVAREDTNRVMFTFDAKAGQIVLKADAQDTGAVEQTLLADEMDMGKPDMVREWACNFGYMLQALQSVDGARIRIAGNAPLQPCIVTAPDDPLDWQYVLMPMQIV